MIRKPLQKQCLMSVDGAVVGTLYLYEALDEDQRGAINAEIPDAQVIGSAVFLPTPTGRPRR